MTRVDGNNERKNQFLNSIKECIKIELPKIEEKYHMNIALRLWPGCLDTAKTLSLKTMSGRNTGDKRKLIIPTILSRANNDPIYKKALKLLVSGNQIPIMCVSTESLVTRL